MGITRIDVSYVDALPGAGKTSSLKKIAVNKAKQGGLVCIALPTIKLLGEIQEDISRQHDTSQSWELVSIHSKMETEDDVTTAMRIINYLKSPCRGGRILLITHASLLALPYFPYREDWLVFIDEIPNIIKVWEQDVTSELLPLLKSIDLVPDTNGLFALQAQKNKFSRAITRLIENTAGKAAIKKIKELVQFITSKSITRYVTKKSWEEMLMALENEGSGEFKVYGQTNFHMFTGFKQLVILGALFKDSFLYLLWQHEGITLRSFQPIQKDLPSDILPHPGHVNILYFTEKRWSRYLHSQEIEFEGKTGHVLDHCKNALSSFQKDKPFLYMLNNDEKNLECPNAVRLSGVPHGSNEYLEMSDIAMLSAINLTPFGLSILKRKGINRDQVELALLTSVTFQTVMRGKARIGTSIDDGTWIVPTRQVAESLGTKLKNKSINQLPSVPSLSLLKAKIKSTDSERQRKCRRKALIEEVRKLAINQSVWSSKTDNIDSYKENVTAPFLFQPNLRVQCFKNVWQQPIGDLSFEVESSDQYLECLSILNQDKANKEKEGHYLISPATYGNKINEKGNISRQRINIEYLWGLFLDVDNGDMTPKDFMNIFPDINMACFNTWRGIGRYRIFIPTSCFLTASAYEAIIKEIIAVVETKGWASSKNESNPNSQLNGIDPASMRSTQIFRVPSKASTGDHDSFFHLQGGKLFPVIEFLSKVLTKNDVIEQPTILMDTTTAGDREISEAIEESAIACVDKYKNLPKGVDKRHHGFFICGLELAQLGLTRNKIEEYLYLADSDGKRGRKAVVDILNRLRMYEKIAA